MKYHDKIQLTLIIIAPPDQAAESDRLFQSHGVWMEATHYRTGEKALLSYNVSKMKELSISGTPHRPQHEGRDADLRERYEQGGNQFQRCFHEVRISWWP